MIHGIGIHTGIVRDGVSALAGATHIIIPIIHHTGIMVIIMTGITPITEVHTGMDIIMDFMMDIIMAVTIILIIVMFTILTTDRFTMDRAGQLKQTVI